jgi:hypothetical protein
LSNGPSGLQKHRSRGLDSAERESACPVIYVPQGDCADPTRSPTFYDATYRYLAEIGISELK